MDLRHLRHFEATAEELFWGDPQGASVSALFAHKAPNLVLSFSAVTQQGAFNAWIGGCPQCIPSTFVIPPMIDPIRIA